MKIYANRAFDLITRDCNRLQLQATKIKYKMNTLIPLLKTRSHGTHLFSFRFYEYVFHCFPYMHKKKNPCHVSFYLYISLIYVIYVLLRFRLCYIKIRVFEFPVMVKNRSAKAYILWFSIFRVIHMPYCHIYIIHFFVEKKILLN